MRVQNKAGHQNVLQKAQRLCAMQEKCTHDMEMKLKDWGCEPGSISMIIDQLVKDGFLSDRRYANTFAREKFRFNKWGKIKIGYQLKQKGISSSIIHESLDEINESDYYNLLYHELVKKYKTLKGNNILEQKQKLFRFASGRGFESEIINMAVDKILGKL